MDHRRNLWKWIILVPVIAAIGFGCFLLGRHTTDSKYQAEQEYYYRISRSDLDGLGEITGPIYVTGHRSPDSDTVGSSIAYAALLQKLGYDAHPVVLGNINRETRLILETGGIEVPMLLEDASGCNMILVDHSEYIQSAKGLKDARILSVIDHHGDGSVTTGNPLIYDARPLGSTATIIWTRYLRYGIEIDRQVAYAMVGSILSDTVNLQSAATTFADREALKALSGLAGISDTDALFREMEKESHSYEGMTDEEIFFHDYKEYENSGKKYGIGCADANDEEEARFLAESMKEVLAVVPDYTGMDMTFAQITILHDGISVTYLVPSDETAAAAIETMFGEKAVFDGISYRLEPGISRKRDLVPAITKLLSGED